MEGVHMESTLSRRRASSTSAMGSSQVLFFLIPILCSFLSFGGVFGFNLEPKLPVIKRGEPSSYFGFSVAQHSTENRTPWILVGAPLGQNRQPLTNRSGALYKCPITSNEEDCEQVVTDGQRDPATGFYEKITGAEILSPPLPDELKDGQWLGVNVRSQGEGGKVVVCAHRYVHQGKDFRWGLGLCHVLTQQLEYNMVLEPCRNKQRRALEDYGYCQAGTSVDFLRDDQDTALTGAPGAYTCRGMVFGQSVLDDYLRRDRSVYQTPTVESAPVDKYSYLGMSVTGGQFFGDHWSYVSGAPKAALGSGQVFFFRKSVKKNTTLQQEGVITGEGFASGFGYELAKLDINGDNKTDLAVGAPFFMGEKQAGGAVYIYLNDNGFHPNHPYVRLTGSSESRFGYALSSAGDLNRDGYDDLAVGAPYDLDSSGSVYIYLGSSEGILREPSQVIKGKEFTPNLKTFGYSLSGGIDLDRNAYPDLLVGAYESDAIVLLRSRPIIDMVTNVYGNLSNIDPNSNGCHAFPNSNQTCFSFIACFEITGINQFRTNSLQVEYRIEAETFVEGKKFSRALFHNGRRDRPQVVSQTVTIQRSGSSSKHCSNETVFLKEGTKDIQSPIAFKLTYTLLRNEPKYNPSAKTLPNIQNYPILNQQEASKVFLASFEKDCGENDLCESDLYVNASPELETDEFGHYLLVLGRDNVFVLNISVANFGEPAYEAALYVSHPKSMSYIGQDAELQKKGLGCTPVNSSLVSCPLGNPYKRHADLYRYLRLRFDAGNLKDIETKLDFEMWTNSTSFDSEEGNNRHTVTATVIKKAELSITGTGEPEKLFYVYGGTVIGESAIKALSEIGPRVTHQYEVWNAGPWKAQLFHVDIWWPHQVENGKSQGKWLLYPESKPMLDGDGECFLPADAIDILHLRTKRETETIIASQKEKGPDGKYKTYVEMNCVRGSAKCYRIECIIRNLLPRESAVIKIHSRLWNATLVEDYPTVDEVRIRSKAQIRISDEIRQDTRNDVAQALTTCFPDLKLKVELEGIAWWIYAVSILVGILVLALIVYCLYKTGFFKRRRPEPTHTARVSRS